MGLTEKQQIEQSTAELFLRLINSEKANSYEVIKMSDTPDVMCRDPLTGKTLELEITLLEDLPGEIKHMLGRGCQPSSPTTGTHVRSFYDDVVPQLIRALEKSCSPPIALLQR